MAPIRSPRLQRAAPATRAAELARGRWTVALPRRGAHLSQFVLILLVTSTLCACRAELSTPAESESRLLRASPGKAMLRTELYFGIARRDGGSVSEADWRAFLRNEVTPRFPAGLTVLESRGQWRGAENRLVEEPSRVVIVLYEPGDADANRRIEEIRVRYKRLFDQDSVMRADSVQRVSF